MRRIGVAQDGSANSAVPQSTACRALALVKGFTRSQGGRFGDKDAIDVRALHPIAYGLARESLVRSTLRGRSVATRRQGEQHCGWCVTRPNSSSRRRTLVKNAALQRNWLNGGDVFVTKNRMGTELSTEMGEQSIREW